MANFSETNVQKHCQEFNVPLFRLTVNDSQWHDIVVKALNPREPIITGYRCDQKLINGNNQNFITLECCEIIPVDQEMINFSFPGCEDLLEEMSSDRESVEAFLYNSFGVVALKEDPLAGWCHSEYN